MPCNVRHNYEDMPKENPTEDTPEPANKPKKRRAVGRTTKEVLRLDNEDDFAEPEYLCSMPERGDERAFIKRNFGAGLYLVQEKQGGKFKNRYEIRIEEPQEGDEPKRVVKFENEFEEDESETNFSQQADIYANVTTENLLLKQRLSQLEREVRSSNQRREGMSDMERMLLAVNEARREEREMMTQQFQMMMQNQQPQPPQQPQLDSSMLAMNAMDKALSMFQKAQEVSDVLSPPARETGGSILGDAAQLIDSLKDIAPSVLPMLIGAMKPQTARPQAATRRSTAPKRNESNAPTNKPSLSELFANGSQTQNAESEKNDE